MRTWIVFCASVALLGASPVFLAETTEEVLVGRYVATWDDGDPISLVIIRPDGTFRVATEVASTAGTWRMLAPNLVETTTPSPDLEPGVIGSLDGSSGAIHFDVRDVEGTPLAGANIEIECVDGSRFRIEYVPPITSVRRCVPRIFDVEFPGKRRERYVVNPVKANSFVVTLGNDVTWERSMVWCVIDDRLYRVSPHSLGRE